MKQFIFLFALLLSAVATFAQSKAQNGATKPLSDAEYAARKNALYQKYGPAEYGNHAAEMYAPTAEAATAKLITKDALVAAAPDSYEKFADLIDKPIALLKIANGEKITLSQADYKTADDATRECIDKYKEFITIND